MKKLEKKTTKPAEKKAEVVEEVEEVVAEVATDQIAQAAGVELVPADEDDEIEEVPGGGTRVIHKVSRRYK